MTRLIIQFLMIILFAVSLYFILHTAQKSTLPLSMSDLGKGNDLTGKSIANQAILPFQPVPFEKLTNSVKSPIFFSSRKFGSAVTALPPVQNSGIAVSTISLHGIVIQEEARKALLQQPGQAKKWYIQGQTIGGWNITNISKNVVRLERRNEKAQISLYRKN